MMNSRLRFWLLYWGTWALFSVYMATMDFMRHAKEAFFQVLIPMNLMQNLVWGCAGLVVLAMARRWPLARLNWVNRGNWIINLIGTVVIAVVSLLLVWLLNVLFTTPDMQKKMLAYPVDYFYGFFSMFFHLSLLLMWAVLGTYHGARILGLSRKQELEAAQLQSRLAMAQNRALQMQLQPHFLFNTLNSIAALIHSDQEAADKMLTRLADLLRMTLDSGSVNEISLRQEMTFTDTYLSIEAIRFQDRLTIQKDVPPDCMDALVPAFLLQPLVENAIKHGVADLARSATILIRAQRDDNWLTLDVVDNGCGINGHAKRGIGTQNTATRLQLMYQDRHAFDMNNLPGGGTQVTVRIPWLTQHG
jgi:signal transduction histidine kinase